MSDLPPLPKLSGEVILEVFTHRSLRFGGLSSTGTSNDNSRLAELGSKVLDLAATTILFKQAPILKASDIAQIRGEHLADDRIERFVDFYGLRSKLRFAPAEQETIRSPEESRLLFNSYIGAAYDQSGIGPIQDWFSRIINPDAPPLTRMQSPPYSESDPYPDPLNHAATAPPPTPVPPPPPATAPPPMPRSTHPYLPIINQTAAQKSCEISYHAQSTGPPHQPTWMIKCLINGEEKGSGMGKNQKIAKEAAAKQAFFAMGWDASNY